MYYKANKVPKIPAYQSIAQMILLTNKNYFYIKNKFHDKIEELQDSLGSLVNFFELLDMQHLIIRELDRIAKELYTSLSFRKLIIERKERVLKDLNQEVINRFIDKISQYEKIITELKKENSQLSKTNNNDNNQINSVANKQNIPINVIAPKNNYEFIGTINFFSNKVKNAQKFINIKNGELSKDKQKTDVKEMKSLSMKNITNTRIRDYYEQKGKLIKLRKNKKQWIKKINYNESYNKKYNLSLNITNSEYNTSSENKSINKIIKSKLLQSSPKSTSTTRNSKVTSFDIIKKYGSKEYTGKSKQKKEH